MIKELNIYECENGFLIEQVPTSDNDFKCYIASSPEELAYRVQMWAEGLEKIQASGECGSEE